MQVTAPPSAEGERARPPHPAEPVPGARRLGPLNQIISASPDPETTLRTIAGAAAELMESPYTAIWLADESASLLERHSANRETFPYRGLRLGEGLSGWAAQQRCVVNVPDVMADPRTVRRDWFEAHGLRSLLAVPIVCDDVLLGVLTLIRKQPFVLEPEVRDLLEGLVAQSAAAIRNAQLFAAAERRRREAETLAVLAQTIGAKLDLATVLQQAVEAARDLVGGDLAQIALREADDAMVMRFGAPLALTRAFEDLRIEKGKGLGGLAWRLRRVLRSEDLLRDARVTRDYDAVVRAQGLAAVIVAPIVIDDEVEGLLYVDRCSATPFTEHDESVLAGLAPHIAIAIQHARLFEDVRSAREQLVVLSRQLIDVQEAERRHLARELHDDLGQMLTGLGLHLARLRADLGAAHGPRLAQCEAVVRRLIGQVRDRALDLHPAVLDDLGLVRALEWYVTREAQTADLDGTVVAEPADLRWPGDLELVCFRVAQEALTNVVRHARARRVGVELRQTPTRRRLEVRDDGAGFDVEGARKRATRGATLGLLSMQERVQLAGGVLEIRSAPGGGTVVRASFPLTPER